VKGRCVVRARTAKGRCMTRGVRGEQVMCDEGCMQRRGNVTRATTMRQCDVARGDTWPRGDATEAMCGEGRREKG
jgi:hypothetical protein